MDLHALAMTSLPRSFLASVSRLRPIVLPYLAHFRGLAHFSCSVSALVLTLALVTATFAFVRVPVWFDYFLPAYTPDTQTYFAPAYQLITGHLPIFDLRTPGYPLFLFAVLGLTHSIRAVLIAQQLATLLAALSLPCCVFALRRDLTLLSLFPGIGVVASLDTVNFELHLLPESLYSACLLTLFGTLLLGMRRRSPVLLGVASLLMATAILLRPAGFFLLGTFLLSAAAAMYLRVGRRALLSLIVPLPALLLALCCYNLATLGRFTVSPFGPANLVAATATYWPTVPTLPGPVNDAIRRMHATVHPADRDILESTWNPWRLQDVFQRYYTTSVWYVLVPALDRSGVRGINAQASYMAVLSRAAIQRRPLLYTKFVFSSFYILLHSVEPHDGVDPTNYYYVTFVQKNYLATDFYPAFRNQLAVPTERLSSFRSYALGEYAGSVPLHNFRLTVPDNAHAPPSLVRIPTRRYEMVERFQNNLFRPVFLGRVWSLPIALILLLAPLVCWRSSQGRVWTAAWACLVSVLSLLGALLLIASVEEPLVRYGYPTSFIYYLSPVLLAWLLLEAIRPERLSYDNAPTDGRAFGARPR